MRSELRPRQLRVGGETLLVAENWVRDCPRKDRESLHYPDSTEGKRLGGNTRDPEVGSFRAAGRGGVPRTCGTELGLLVPVQEPRLMSQCASCTSALGGVCRSSGSSSPTFRSRCCCGGPMLWATPTTPTMWSSSEPGVGRADTAWHGPAGARPHCPSLCSPQQAQNQASQ